MAHKLFKHSFFYGIFILLLCVAVFTVFLYKQMEERVYSELGIEAAYLAEGIERDGEDFLEDISVGRRITWVDAQGGILYDNRAEISGMDNHMDRQEIADAMKYGSGRSKHFSSINTRTTLYYAMRMSDGTVIRVSAAQDSIVSLLKELLGPIIWTLLLVSILCGLLSSRVAKQITKPINELNLDDPASGNPYKELKPLVSRVKEQNRTIRRQMDELLARQREFDAITGNMSEGLILVDERGVVVSSNASGLAAVAGSMRELRAIDRSCCIPEVCDGMDLAFAGKRYETVISYPTASLELMVSPVRSGGRVSGAVILALDVTEREQREQLRREFSANVSHELRTPLTTISGFAELMKEGLVPEEKMKEFSGDIYDESRRLLSLVEDIMRLSRIDESDGSLLCEEVRILDLVREAVHPLRSAAKEAQVELNVSGSECVLWGNRRLLNEMVYNLADNAIKYNKSGGTVEINVFGNGEECILSVKDSGIGIPAEHHKRIFERFYRVDKSHSRAIGGTGLGLSIVRHGVRLHNARLQLESEEGKGSEFKVIFPLKEADV